ncbi:acyl-CoA thioesterase [Algihabitans albus]|uniref:acyl-CoA thioesterase n=1 Tax=Algihabitans albus TaxID=2164067 RepID=UPI000E5C7F4E|nr:thioesterase family protein [Algihabitans albus]
MSSSNGRKDATPAPDPTDRDLYASWTKDILRYRDTDRQGHVNNAVFATFLESGRVAIFYDPEQSLAPEGASFVIARLALDFRAELHWPGDIQIGTSVTRIGTSSMTLAQGLFAKDTCVATAETVLVLMDDITRKSRPLTDSMRERLSQVGSRRSSAR